MKPCLDVLSVGLAWAGIAVVAAAFVYCVTVVFIWQALFGRWSWDGMLGRLRYPRVSASEVWVRR